MRSNIPSSEYAEPHAPSQDLTTRTVTSLFWLFSSNFANTTMRLAIVPILARILAPEAFGIAAAASVVTGFASIFSNVGIAPALMRLENVEPRHTKTGLTISTLLGLLAGAISIALAPWIAQFFNSPELTMVLYAQALLFPLRGLTVVCESMMQREMAFRRLAMIESVSYIVGYCLVAVTGALAGWGVWAIIAGTMTQNLIRVVLVVFSRLDYARAGFDWDAARTLARDGSGFTAMRTLAYVATQLDYMIVGRFLGMDVLGLYTKAYELLTRPANTLTATIRRPLFAGLVSIQSQEARLRRTFMRAVSIMSLVFIPATPLAVILSPELVLVILGDQWTEAILPFRALSTALYFVICGRITMTVLQARGVLLRGTYYYIFFALAILVGAWVGQFWGIGGVAWGVAGAFFVSFLLSTALVLNNLQISWVAFARIHARGVILAIGVLAVVWTITALVRPYDQPLLTLLAVGLVFGVVGLVLLVLAPRRLLGNDTDWLMARRNAFLHTLAGLRRTKAGNG
ncbi:MAG: lipopolysaccharide biosynthesis protein [Litorilinea sp.]